jgi:hypothetical protein
MTPEITALIRLAEDSLDAAEALLTRGHSSSPCLGYIYLYNALLR